MRRHSGAAPRGSAHAGAAGAGVEGEARAGAGDHLPPEARARAQVEPKALAGTWRTTSPSRGALARRSATLAVDASAASSNIADPDQAPRPSRAIRSRKPLCSQPSLGSSFRPYRNNGPRRTGVGLSATRVRREWGKRGADTASRVGKAPPCATLMVPTTIRDPFGSWRSIWILPN